MWNLVSSCTLTEGTTSHGITQASMVPLESASGICGSGMPTGVAPSAASSLVTCRVGPRTFMPFRSAVDFTSLVAEWNMPGPCTCRAMTCVSLNSSGAWVWMYSQYAFEVASAFVMMNGSSNTSTRGKRPAVLPGRVQTTSTTPSRAWS